MADAEYASGNFSETGAKREVVILQHESSKLRLIESVRHYDRCAGSAILCGIQTEQFQAPAAHRATSRFTEPEMPLEHLF